MPKTTIPPEVERAQRRAASTLLAVERRALEELRRAVERVVEHAIVSIAKGGDAARVTHQALRDIEAALAPLLLAARTRAGDAATAQLRVELQLASTTLRSAGVDVDLRLPAAPRAPSRTDAAHADAVARAYATAWTLVVLRIVRTSKQVARDIDATTRHLDYRLKRIAATESAQAFTDAHDEGIGYALAPHRGARWLPAVVKVWSATIDRATCAFCRARDGEWVLPGQTWDEGAEPGYAHPLCRCTETLMILPARLPAAAAAGAYTGLEDDDADAA